MNKDCIDWTIVNRSNGITPKKFISVAQKKVL